MLKVALIQPNSKGTIEEIIERAERLISQAAKMGAELACLPEHWIHAKDFNNHLPIFIKLAKKENIAIATGGNYVEDKEGRKVRSYFINNEGEIIGKQDKIHLFRGEKEVALPGNEFNVFNFNDTKISICICHDLVYPEAVRIFVLKGAEILLCPSRIKKIGYEPWKLYVLTRALENRINIIAVNTLLLPEFEGKSFAVDFDIIDDVIIPKIIASAEEKEGFIIAEIDPKKMEKIRKERLNNRRPEVYVDILKK
jgi:predicted amidohydrolase